MKRARSATAPIRGKTWAEMPGSTTSRRAVIGAAAVGADRGVAMMYRRGDDVAAACPLHASDRSAGHRPTPELASAIKRKRSVGVRRLRKKVAPLWRRRNAAVGAAGTVVARRAAERASGGAIEGNGGSQDPSSWRQISPPSWPLERLRRASVLQYEGRIRAFPANGRSLHPKGQSYSILSANSHQSALHRSYPGR